MDEMKIIEITGKDQEGNESKHYFSGLQIDDNAHVQVLATSTPFKAKMFNSDNIEDYKFLCDIINNLLLQECLIEIKEIKFEIS